MGTEADMAAQENGIRMFLSIRRQLGAVPWFLSPGILYIAGLPFYGNQFIVT